MMDGSEIPEADERRSAEANVARFEAATDNQGPTETVEHDKHVVGHPQELGRYWERQQGQKECALYAQGTALEAFGKPFDINRLRQAGEADGTFDPAEGTKPKDLGDVWEREGLAVVRHGGQLGDGNANSAFRFLVTELTDGKAVNVAVETGPIWGNWDVKQEERGHALWVTGLEWTTSGKMNVVCNDSGRSDGQQIAYSVEDFERAWRKWNYQMISTRDPMTGA